MTPAAPAMGEEQHMAGQQIITQGEQGQILVSQAEEGQANTAVQVLYLLSCIVFDSGR